MNPITTPAVQPEETPQPPSTLNQGLAPQQSFDPTNISQTPATCYPTPVAQQIVQQPQQQQTQQVHINPTLAYGTGGDYLCEWNNCRM